MQRVGEFLAADVLAAPFGKEEKFAHVYRQSSNSFVWNSMVFQRLPDLAIKFSFTSGSVRDCIHSQHPVKKKRRQFFEKVSQREGDLWGGDWSGREGAYWCPGDSRETFWVGKLLCKNIQVDNTISRIPVNLVHLLGFLEKMLVKFDFYPLNSAFGETVLWRVFCWCCGLV